MGFKVGSVFFKKVEGKHFMKILNGYGLQYDAFCELENEGMNEIYIIKKKSKKVWVSKPGDWLKNGKIADYGRGKQIFLSLKFMKLKDTEKEKAKQDRAELERAQINSDKLFT